MSYESPSPPNLAIANSAHQLRSNAEGLPTTGDPRAVSMTSYNRLLPVPRPTIVPPIILRTGHARRWQRSAKMLDTWARSEEHTSELQSLMRISYAVFCLKKKKTTKKHETNNNTQTKQTKIH